MVRLSTPIENIKEHYTVVVIGSGYGGGITASRLARAGQLVCLLERGKEFQPGEYPNATGTAVPEMQGDFPEGHLGSRTGLYDFHVNEDINVFKGCGLGGTSLVNANVSLHPEPRVFEDPRWPAALRADVETRLEAGFARAQEMLKPKPYPENAPPLRKLQMLEQSAQHLNAKFYAPPINVNFDVDGPNHVGVKQKPCNGCGDCVSGCNYHAKNTVLMNYLPDANNHGVEIYTQVDVRFLERKDGQWLVHYHILETGQEAFDAPTMFVTADIVVLAGGTLGSTEILLRSRQNGLALSDQIGQGFSGNGDVLAFAYNTENPVDGIGWGTHKPGDLPIVGPCITGIIDQRDPDQPLNQNMVIEDGSICGALTFGLSEAFAAAAEAVGNNLESGLVATSREYLRKMESLIRGPYHGATQHTQTYLVMSHDDDEGRMVLENDRLRVLWPRAGSQPIYQTVNERLTEATRPLGGYFVKNPIWSKMLRKELITVHPLGGCRLAESAESGVVNHKGQVFSGTAGDAVYDSLYVADGSIVPRSLGVNPLLTISALAERCVALLAEDRGWTIDYTLPSAPPVPAPEPQPAAAPMGLQFTETMKGFFAPAPDYPTGEQRGEANNSPFAFILTIVSEDLNAMLDLPDHPARMVGVVNAPALSPQPLAVTDGAFELFVDDPQTPATRLMRYRARMTAQDGKTYLLDGFKRVPVHPFWYAWPDTTTLYLTVYEGESADNPVWGRGILRILPADFAREMTTLQILNAPTHTAALEGKARFLSFFAGTLLDAYGGIFARHTVFHPDAPPRQKRPLRVSLPEVYPFVTPDGVTLRLTRYQGGTRGPVILSHGLGVSSLIFAIDTIDTNLLEYLYAHGYDVWLLDYRASIALPETAGRPANGDEIATQDYPAAVAKVREITGRTNVQVVVHCYGATTFTMAMLAGLQGVRSAVISQISAHVRTPEINSLRAGLHLPGALEKLGVHSLTAYVDAHADWLSRLYDKGLDIYAEIEAQGWCNDPVCHRITFMYASLYEHAQLNPSTHSALHEMFGIASIRQFEHLTAMIRAGKVVNYQGEDVYVPHLERMAIPICFIHGADNICFLPESTEITYNALCARNGSDLYTRHVIPGYGHIDCIFGKNAVADIYPFILAHLEKTNP